LTTAIAGVEINPDESARHAELSYYESFFRGMEYGARTCDFDGRPARPAFGNAAEMGFIFAPRDDGIPYSNRQPLAPSRLARTVVNRFTGLLFAHGATPTVRVLGDPATEDWIDGLVDESRLWAALREARGYGGSMGTAVVSVAVHDGHVVWERHNPKRVTPEWIDRARCLLGAIEIRYMFPRVERRQDGTQETVWYHYRRRIDTDADTVYHHLRASGRGAVRTPVPSDWQERKRVPHEFGCCPAAWIQNTENSEDIDGEPDCAGQYPAIVQHDEQLAHAVRATGKNCDPTPVVKTKKHNVGDILQKGSNHAILPGVDGDAHYMEMAGGGTVQARENVATLKHDILEACDVVLESEASVATTATEINYRHRAMFARVDTLRDQYGPALVRLLEMVTDYARRVGQAREEPADATDDGEQAEQADETGELPPQGPPRFTRRLIHVPPKVEDDPDDPEKPATIVPREIGPGGVIKLMWPEHTTPTPAEVETTQRHLVAANAAGWIDGETAARQYASTARLPNPIEAYRKAQREKAERDVAAESREDALNERLLAGIEGKPPAQYDDTDDDTDDDEG